MENLENIIDLGIPLALCFSGAALYFADYFQEKVAEIGKPLVEIDVDERREEYD